MISVSDITSTQLRDYAKSLGWTQVARDFAQGLFVMRNVVHQGRELVFPVADDVNDFSDAMTSVLEKLAYLHNTTLEKVLTGVVDVNLPPPVDETAAATAINAQSDAVDALITKITPAP